MKADIKGYLQTIREFSCPEGQRQGYKRIGADFPVYVQVTSKGTKSLVYRRYINKTWRQDQLAELPAEQLNNTKDPKALAEIQKIVENAFSAAAVHAKTLSDGGNPFDQAKATREEPTLQELFDSYVETHLRKNGRRVDVTIKDFDRWFTKLAKQKASALSRQDAERFHGQITKERGQYAANRAIQLGRAIYNKAKQGHLFLGDNPFAGVTLWDEQARDRFLSKDEAAKLLNKLTDAPAHHCDYRTLRDFILIDLFTGVRKANLLSMEWGECDFDAGTWSIPAQKVKNKKPHIVPLGANEIAILKERKQILKAAGIVSEYFGAKRSLSSVQIDHRFRSKPITSFGANRTPAK